MVNKSWFQAGVAILLALLIIMLFREINDVFQPLVIIASTVFLPLLLAGVLFYLTQPVSNWLENKGMPRWGSILSVFLLLILFFWILYAMIGPIVIQQSSKFAENTPEMVDAVEDGINYFMNQRDRLPQFAIDSLKEAEGNIEDWAMSFGSWLFNFLQGFLQTIALVVLTPFFLFYMLKDRERFLPFFTQFFSGRRKRWVTDTLLDLDHTLRSYIQGQLLVSFLVGVMLYIGYLIIGLDYSLVLALIGMATNVIPFLGPYLAVMPALFVAWIQEPQMVIWVALVMLIAQQIESNLISPNVMGKALHIHPLTVITLILAAGNIAGLWGIILAIPTYAALKTIVVNLYEERRRITEAATKEVE
ncbi:AI-2E family transporter [Bacillus thermotolerans]|uniref:AI-2E family transporter n=1 Tax=Bacillus thermotolerans TaxID=1221996 RepID=UPI0005890549|nr:AI-2E family transporter [Bacillus thermotolerans]KKB40132.1 Membrane protein YrrI [Bacillus thermotolerans]